MFQSQKPGHEMRFLDPQFRPVCVTDETGLGHSESRKRLEGVFWLNCARGHFRHKGQINRLARMYEIAPSLRPNEYAIDVLPKKIDPYECWRNEISQIIDTPDRNFSKGNCLLAYSNTRPYKTPEMPKKWQFFPIRNTRNWNDQPAYSFFGKKTFVWQKRVAEYI